MTAYQTAIKKAAHFIKDKVIRKNLNHMIWVMLQVVLDVGCGTGIMSLLAVKLGGPKKVQYYTPYLFVSATLYIRFEL